MTLALAALPHLPGIVFHFALPLAETMDPWWDEVGLGIAVVLTFIGMIMHWIEPRRRMSAEEHVKDGDLTEEQARWRIKMFGRVAFWVTVIGVGLLVWTVFQMIDFGA